MEPAGTSSDSRHAPLSLVNSSECRTHTQIDESSWRLLYAVQTNFSPLAFSQQKDMFMELAKDCKFLVGAVFDPASGRVG